MNAPETGLNNGPQHFDAVSDALTATTKRKAEMKLTPEEHRKAAADLQKLAEAASKPEEKQHLLATAQIFESLAKLGERRAQEGRRTDAAEA